MDDGDEHGPEGSHDEEELRVWVAAQRLLSSFVFLADRGRSTELAELFAEDGVLEWVGVGKHTGRDEIRQWIDAARVTFLASPTPAVRHHCSSMHVQLADRHTAHASSYWLAVTAQGGPDHWGTYRDVLVEREGRWLFSHRSVKVDGHVPGSVSALAAEAARGEQAVDR